MPRLRVVAGAVSPAPALENAPLPAQAPANGKSKGGRPPGSRNKVYADVRARLAELTPKMVEDLYREAHLGYCWNVTKNGSKERVMLSPAERFERVKLLIDKTLPSLKAVESVIDQTTRDETPEADNRQLSRALIMLARESGQRITVSDKNDVLVKVPPSLAHLVPGEHVVGGVGEEISDAGSTAPHDDDAAGGASVTPSAPSLDDIPPGPYYPGFTWQPYRGQAPFIQNTHGDIWRVIEANGVIVGPDYPGIRSAAKALIEHAGGRYGLLETTKDLGHG